jgi:hypothetical protein
MSNQPRIPRRGLRLAIGIVAALFVLSVLALVLPVVRVAAQEKRVASPLRMVPEDAGMFLHIRLPDLARSDLFLLIPDQERQQSLRDLTFGMPAEQVDTITVTFLQAPLLSMLDPDARFFLFGGRATRKEFLAPPRFRDFDFKDVIKEAFKDVMPFPKDGARMKKGFRKNEGKDRPPGLPPKGFFKDDEKKTERPVADKLDDVARALQVERFGGRPTGPKGFGVAPQQPDDKQDPFGQPQRVFILTTRADIEAEDLILMRPENAFKSKGRTILQIGGFFFHRLDRRTMVGSDQRAVLERFLDRPVPAEFKGPLRPALEVAASGKHTITLGQAIPEKELDEEMTRAEERGLSRAADRGVIRALMPLLRARPAAVGLNLQQQDAALAAEFHFADDAAASKAMDAARDAVVLLRVFGVSSLEETLFGPDAPLEKAELERATLLKLLLSSVEDGLRAARVEQQGSKVQVGAALPTTVAKLQERARVVAKETLKDPKFLAERRRRASQNNLKQIVLALHNHHDTYRTFPPPAICDPNGKPLLSWRVAILPFVEEGQLYREFRLNEPWDSAHNIKLLERMPKIYATPGVKTRDPYATYYQAFVGPNAGFELRLAPNAQFGAIGTRLPADFPDGTSFTLLIVEAAEPVPWSKPADLKFDFKGPLPKVGGPYAPGFNAAFADGNVRYYARPPQESILRALITRNGGEVVDPDAR